METYRYIVRPAEETGALLIEFLDLPANKEFIKHIIHAFESVNVQVVNYGDLWMNDEIVLNASSDIGPFTIFRDAADYYFITANDNPGAIPKLDALLDSAAHFRKA